MGSLKNGDALSHSPEIGHVPMEYLERECVRRQCLDIRLLIRSTEYKGCVSSRQHISFSFSALNKDLQETYDLYSRQHPQRNLKRPPCGFDLIEVQDADQYDRLTGMTLTQGGYWTSHNDGWIKNFDTTGKLLREVKLPLEGMHTFFADEKGLLWAANKKYPVLTCYDPVSSDVRPYAIPDSDIITELHGCAGPHGIFVGTYLFDTDTTVIYKADHGELLRHMEMKGKYSMTQLPDDVYLAEAFTRKIYALSNPRIPVFQAEIKELDRQVNLTALDRQTLALYGHSKILAVTNTGQKRFLLNVSDLVGAPFCCANMSRGDFSVDGIIALNHLDNRTVIRVRL